MANKKALREREREALAQQESLRNHFRSADQRCSKAAITPEEIGRLVHEYFVDDGRIPLRGPETFNRSMKTRDHDRIALAYVLHMFTDYKVPQHIQQIMLDASIGSWVVRKNGKEMERRQHPAANARVFMTPSSPHLKERFNAFFIVGQGKSLFKELLKEKLSKKEVHTFLNCPPNVTYDEALVYAMARSFTDNHGLALRLAKTRVARGDFPAFKIGKPFFRETIRFFSGYDLPLKEINDLCDYIFRRATMNKDNTFNTQWSYRGRTPQALHKQMVDWHHELRRMRSIGGGNWDGLPVPDTIFAKQRSKCLHTNKEKRVDWRITQIKTGDELAKEGTAMHHCVASYKHQCMAGHTGIFSVTSSDHNMGCWTRNLTIEVTTRSGWSSKSEGPLRIAQVRGFANRAPKPEELAIVRRWAEENSLDMTRYY